MTQLFFNSLLKLLNAVITLLHLSKLKFFCLLSFPLVLMLKRLFYDFGKNFPLIMSVPFFVLNFVCIMFNIFFWLSNCIFVCYIVFLNTKLSNPLISIDLLNLGEPQKSSFYLTPYPFPLELIGHIFLGIFFLELQKKLFLLSGQALAFRSRAS